MGLIKGVTYTVVRNHPKLYKAFDNTEYWVHSAPSTPVPIELKPGPEPVVYGGDTYTYDDEKDPEPKPAASMKNSDNIVEIDMGNVDLMLALGYLTFTFALAAFIYFKVLGRKLDAIGSNNQENSLFKKVQ